MLDAILCVHSNIGNGSASWLPTVSCQGLTPRPPTDTTITTDMQIRRGEINIDKSTAWSEQTTAVTVLFIIIIVWLIVSLVVWTNNAMKCALNWTDVSMDQGGKDQGLSKSQGFKIDVTR